MIGYNLIAQKERVLIFKNKWIGLILIYVILSFGWYFYRPIVFVKEGQKIMWNVRYFLSAVDVILAIFIIKDLVEYTDNLNRWVTIAKVLCWTGFSFSVYAILQYLGLDQIFTKNLKWVHPNKMITFMGNSMHTANFIAILSPLCLMFKDLRYKLFYLFAFIALVLVDSVLSLGAFIVGFLLYLFFMKRFRLTLFLLFLLFISGIILWIYHPQYLSFSGRLELWQMVFDSWKEKAFTGWGLGAFSFQNFKDSTGSIAIACENDYLHILHDGGLFLFVLVCGYLVNLFKRIILSKDSMLNRGYVISLIVYMFIAGGSFIIWIAPMALIGLIYISALETQV